MDAIQRYLINQSLNTAELNALRTIIVKVYASWCKTCAVFDTRYRKLASQLGDTYNPADANTNTNTNIIGRVRFAEMRYDDPNNEEMCRLLNATKLPYILIYKGSRGKVSDFQCGPATFQLLIDEIGKYANVDTNIIVGDGRTTDDADDDASTSSSTSFGGEQEWSVVQQQKQQQRLEQRSATTYGGVGSTTNYQPPNSSSSSSNMERLKRKEEEITRLYTELTNLRRDFDRVIVRMKEEHLSETNKLNEILRDQTKQYENERRSLLVKIDNLSRQIDDQDKAMIVSQQLQNEIQKKEVEYAATVGNLNSRITELETNLSKSTNELQYTITTNTNSQQQLSNHIAALECRILDLEKELIEEKRAVVASTEEASRVLVQLERIKSSEDEERKVLASRVVELEGEISNLENQLLFADSNNNINSVSSVMETTQKDAELDMLKTRVRDLEHELEWQEKTSSMNNDDLSVRGVSELRLENEQLTARITLLEKEIVGRDKVIRTSNKATDILLDEMKAQKHEYEQELSRMSSLVNDLENAIDIRVEEMSLLQERFIALEGLVEGMKQQRNVDLDNAAANANAIQFARETERKSRSQQQQPQEQPGRMGTSSFGQSQNPFGALFGGIKDMTSFGWASSEESLESYEQLRDVLSPDEVSQRRDPSMPRSGAGRVDNVREAPGMSRGDAQPFTYDSTRNSGTAGRYDNIRDGAGSASSSSFGGANTPSPAVIQAATGLPTPALAFERRLAENPIVPAGAFGGSKPTSSFFSKSGASVSVPSDTPEYYQNVISNFNNNVPAPAMPPTSLFDQRPTAPAPRGGSATTGMTENIYAGAGSASTYPRPAPARQETAPIAPQPTPALAFERRLAENPIVPSGAFGGSKPTAHFFSQKSAPASSSNERAGEDYSSSSQSPYPPMDDDQAKWQSLDDFEKKRVAAEAYNSFQKSLEDSRRSTQLKPKGGTSTMGLGIGARTGGGGGGSDRARKPIATAETKNISQIELERKKHQDMVKASVAANEKEMAMPSMTAVTLPKGTVQPRQLNTQQIQASATQASARRLSLAERAAKADQDRRDREKRIKAEARQSQEVQNVLLTTTNREEIRNDDEFKRPEIDLTAAPSKAKSIDVKRAEDVKKMEDIRRAEELKHNAEANLAAAARAKAEAVVVKPRSEIKSSVSIGVAVAASENSDEEMLVKMESSQGKETIEAALLGAMVVEDSMPLPESDNSEPQVKGNAIDRTAEKAKYLVRKALVAGGAAPKYDVVITKSSKNEIDMAKLLEGSGSLKDLLGRSPKRRRKGNENY